MQKKKKLYSKTNHLAALFFFGLCSNPTIQIDSKGSVEIEGLTEIPISNFTKANWWYTKGRRVRSTSWTNVNEASSRSHWWVKDNSIMGGEILKLLYCIVLYSIR